MFKKLRKLAHSVKDTVQAFYVACIAVFKRHSAEGYVDSGVKILIAVVLGALLLTGLYKLFNTIILPTVSTKVTELFSYAG